MPALKDVERSVTLNDGEIFVGLYDPTKDVRTQESNFGTRYTFSFLKTDGRFVKLRGGNRLFDKIVEVCGTSDKSRWLQITAKGKTATMDKDYEVKEVAAPSK